MIEQNLLEIPIEEADFCVLDVETTGMSAHSCRIIEIGIVRISKMKIKATYRSFLNPGSEIPYFITTLTGITNADVYDAPFFEEISNDVQDFIKDSILTAHNIQFDFPFLKKAMLDCGCQCPSNELLCTLKLARKLYPLLPSKSLGSLTKHLGIRQKNAHRALGDATVTAKALIKMIRQLQTEHGINSVQELLDYQNLSSIAPDLRILKKTLVDDFAKLPDLPGVYYFKNSRGEIIYVGKAKSLKKRVKNYFAPNAPSKAKKIVANASRLYFEITNSELTALLAETQLIKIHNPRFNVMLKGYGQNLFIAILRDHEYPKPSLSRKFDFDGNDYFGPYTNKDTVISMLQLIERAFRLRECKEREFNSHKGCYLSQIYRCLSPCNSNVEEEYKQELEKVYEFLSGKNQVAITRLIEKMKQYSDNQKFEEAIQTRDLINLILSQIHKTSIIAEPVNEAKVMIEITSGVKKDYLLLHSGKLVIKEFIVKQEIDFETALDDYFDKTLSIAEEEYKKDLEKIKITLSWLSRNRNSVRIFYLKDFRSKKELFEIMNGNGRKKIHRPSPAFDIAHLDI